jgi:DNA methyltransferase 1-associated protein 1
LKAIQKSDRTVDELKDRYYSVAKALLEAKGQKSHPIVQKPFSFEQEVRRKYNLEKIFMRTKEQHEKEKLLIASLKNID